MAATQSVPDAADISHSPCECRGDQCGVRFTGYLRLDGDHGLACDQPLLLRVSCGHEWIKRCGRSDETKCKPCAAYNRRLVARKCLIGLEDRPAGWLVYLLTLNAPGSNDHAMWDPGFVRGNRPECNCHTDGAGYPIDLAMWNPTAGTSWNRFITQLRRVTEVQLQFMRFAEVQDGKRRTDGVGRGALHHHNVIMTPVPLDPLEVQRLALAAGYGCVMDMQLIPFVDNRKIANYVAKYVSKGADRDKAKWKVEMVDLATGELSWRKKRATYRSHSSSQDWAITLREIRACIRDVAVRRAAALKSANPKPGVALVDGLAADSHRVSDDFP